MRDSNFPMHNLSPRFGGLWNSNSSHMLRFDESLAVSSGYFGD